MATKLEQYTNTLIQLAQIQGVSAHNPAIFKLSGSSDKVVCVTYEYPSELGTLLPLNVLFDLIATLRYIRLFCNAVLEGSIKTNRTLSGSRVPSSEGYSYVTHTTLSLDPDSLKIAGLWADTPCI
jgi:hypothetical protein